MKKGYAPILIITLLISLAVLGIITYLQFKPKPQIPRTSLQTQNQSANQTNSPNLTNIKTMSSIIINGILLPGLITEDPDAVFSIQTVDGLYKLRVPLREIAGRTCDSESPWPKENSKVFAKGVLTGDKEITCQESGDYFISDSIANWKTYSDKTIEFKYPNDWTTKVCPNGSIDLKSPTEDTSRGQECFSDMPITLTIFKRENYNYKDFGDSQQAILINGKEVTKITTGDQQLTYFVFKNSSSMYLFFKYIKFSGNDYSKEVDQILSTFKFLN